jgi:hypothetical protein
VHPVGFIVRIVREIVNNSLYCIFCLHVFFMYLHDSLSSTVTLIKFCTYGRCSVCKSVFFFQLAIRKNTIYKLMWWSHKVHYDAMDCYDVVGYSSTDVTSGALQVQKPASRLHLGDYFDIDHVPYMVIDHPGFCQSSYSEGRIHILMGATLRRYIYIWYLAGIETILTLFELILRHNTYPWSSGIPRNFVRGGGVQQIQLRTGDRENGDLGAVVP